MTGPNWTLLLKTISAILPSAILLAGVTCGFAQDRAYDTDDARQSFFSSESTGLLSRDSGVAMTATEKPEFAGNAGEFIRQFPTSIFETTISPASLETVVPELKCLRARSALATFLDANRVELPKTILPLECELQLAKWPGDLTQMIDTELQLQKSNFMVDSDASPSSLPVTRGSLQNCELVYREGIFQILCFQRRPRRCRVLNDSPFELNQVIPLEVVHSSRSRIVLCHEKINNELPVYINISRDMVSISLSPDYGPDLLWPNDPLALCFNKQSATGGK